MWMAFLTGYVMPKAYYEKVGAEGFEEAPIGTGPYMVDKFERNAFLRLKANPNYWGGKPAFETVTIKFVPDATSRVAEIESGSSDVTLDIPYEEYDRLKKDGLAGCQPRLRHRDDLPQRRRADARQECPPGGGHAIDKQLLVDRLLRGYGIPIDTLEAPEYSAFDPSIKVAYDPEKAKELLAASGYLAGQAGQVQDPDDARLQAQGLRNDPGDRRHVAESRHRGEIEVYEIAKHYELRATDKLAPAAFYNWGNAIGDPATSTGFAMFGPRPHSVWDGKDLIDMIGPLWGEEDEAKRIAG